MDTETMSSGDQDQNTNLNEASSSSPSCSDHFKLSAQQVHCLLLLSLKCVLFSSPWQRR